MVFEKVRELVSSQFERDKSSITADTSFVEDLGADSLDVVELITDIELEFDLDENDVISSDELETLVTVGDLVAYIEKIVG